MVIWWRVLQVILMLIILWGAGIMYTYVYDTTNYTHGMMVLLVGSINLTLIMVWIAQIQNNIENRKRK